MIYIFPTEEGKPPRAVVGALVIDMGEEGMALAGGMEVSYSRDMGGWVDTAASFPVPKDLSQEITEHALSLGVTL